MASQRTARAESTHVDDLEPPAQGEPSVSLEGFARVSFVPAQANPMFRESAVELTSSVGAGDTPRLSEAPVDAPRRSVVSADDYLARLSASRATPLGPLGSQVASRRRPWAADRPAPGYAARLDRFACGFSLAGGLVGSSSGLYLAESLAASSSSTSGQEEGDGVGAGLGFVAGALAAGLVAVFALPLARPGPRRLAEGLVLLAWVCGTVQLFVYMFHFTVTGGAVLWTQAPGLAYNVALLGFELCGPMPFLALCWGHTNWKVVRLLWSQTQFKIVYVLVAWCIAATAWGRMSANPGRPLYWLALSVFIHSPLAMAPVLDAVEAQSRAFRVGVPALFVVYVASQSYYYGYVLQPTALVHVDDWESASDDDDGEPGSRVNTDAYQVGYALTTILLLMAQFLYNVLKDPTGGGAVCWPLEANITVLREDAERLSFGGFGALKVSATAASSGSGGSGEVAALRARVAALEAEVESLRT